jgi:hypothetical protein
MGQETTDDRFVECSRLWFSGTYNLLMDEAQAYKFSDFVTIMVDSGCSFVDPDRTVDKKIDQSEIKEHFTQSKEKEWIGQLHVPPQALLSILNEFVNKFTGPKEWNVRLRKWLQTAEQYPNLSVTMDFPGQGRLSAVIITYWNYKPSIISTQTTDNRPHSSLYFSVDQAAKTLVEDIYADIDNLFSAYLFEVGQFTYPEHELRKLSFTYGLSVSAPAEALGEQFLSYRQLYKKALLSSSPDELSASQLEADYTLIYTRGFVGMTGQPRLGKTPDLRVLLGRTGVHANDREILNILHALCVIEKADAHLNTISEFYIPSIKHAIDETTAAVRSVSGMAQQLRIDTELCTSFSEMRSLVHRAVLIDDELSSALTNNFTVRKYLAEFLGAALSLQTITREVRADLNFRPLSGPQTFLDSRLAQSLRVGITISDCERRLHKFLEDMLSVQTLVAGTRLTLHQRTQSLGTSPKSVDRSESLETCFVLMAFRKELDDIYEEIVLPIFRENDFGLKCYRADEIFGTSAIIQDVWKAIRQARFIIAELTNRNPNVLYELGISHVLRKPAILITQSMDDVPFDLRHLRCISYSLGPSGLRKLRADLEATVSQLLKDQAREVQVFEG